MTDEQIKALVADLRELSTKHGLRGMLAATSLLGSDEPIMVSTEVVPTAPLDGAESDAGRTARAAGSNPVTASLLGDAGVQLLDRLAGRPCKGLLVFGILPEDDGLLIGVGRLSPASVREALSSAMDAIDQQSPCDCAGCRARRAGKGANKHHVH